MSKRISYTFVIRHCIHIYLYNWKNGAKTVGLIQGQMEYSQHIRSIYILYLYGNLTETNIAVLDEYCDNHQIRHNPTKCTLIAEYPFFFLPFLFFLFVLFLLLLLMMMIISNQFRRQHHPFVCPFTSCPIDTSGAKCHGRHKKKYYDSIYD